MLQNWKNTFQRLFSTEQTALQITQSNIMQFIFQFHQVKIYKYAPFHSNVQFVSHC